jgi:hypothetical protein
MSAKIIISSALVGFVTALATCIAFFFFVYQPVGSSQTPEIEVTTLPNATPTGTPAMPVAMIEIKEPDVTLLALETIYRGFFTDDSECRKSYAQLFGGDGGFFSESSPCKTIYSFERDGGAVKTIELTRYYKGEKVKRVTDKFVWKAKMTGEQFERLAKAIVGSNVFKNWDDTIDINVVNTKITVKHPNGARVLMSNVDESASSFLPLMKPFQQLDGELDWAKMP